ncbi:MAG: hypothetical protein A2Y23_07665 [Clostridiales bacterium GWB2_37_7]|nr:MAG: hypothetical protein A2Y23_07665 [Clostridiales bacterium GWB2_37_7]
MEYTINPYDSKEYSECQKRNIKVNGKGIVEAEPDIVVISLGVVTKDKNPQSVQNLNDEISKKLINALMRAGISRDDIKTSSYSIYPEYDYVDGKQLLSGYTASHILQVKVRDIKKAGEVISTAVQNGANQINKVDFTLEDAKYQYNKALKLAVKDAALKAQAIANAMKVSFDTIPCSITEQSTSFTPLSEQGIMKLAATEAVMPGKIEIIAMVEAEFEFAV